MWSKRSQTYSKLYTSTLYYILLNKGEFGNANTVQKYFIAVVMINSAFHREYSWADNLTLRSYARTTKSHARTINLLLLLCLSLVKLYEQSLFWMHNRQIFLPDTHTHKHTYLLYEARTHYYNIMDRYSAAIRANKSLL